MMLDHLLKTNIYNRGVWYMNGGTKTMWSYDYEVPESHIAWLSTRQRYRILEGGGLVTHAALHPSLSLSVAASIQHDDLNDSLFMHGLLWNREEPVKRERFQIFGHNSHWGLKRFDDWAICIDQSRKRILTGFHWPTLEIFEEPYQLPIRRMAPAAQP